MIQVELPHHLRTLAQISGPIALEVEEPVTLGRVLDVLEARFPVLRGTIRDHDTLERRAFLRFFACEQDWSHEPVDAPLPAAVAAGREPLLVIGAIAGGTQDSRSSGIRNHSPKEESCRPQSQRHPSPEKSASCVNRCRPSAACSAATPKD